MLKYLWRLLIVSYPNCPPHDWRTLNSWKVYNNNDELIASDISYILKCNKCGDCKKITKDIRL